MDIQSIINQGGGIDAIAGQLGIPANVAQSGVAALLPAVMGGFKRSAQGQPEGLEGLLGMIGGMGGGGLFDNVVGAQPTSVDTGNALLGQMFGSKDGSIAVAQHAAATSGVDSSILKKMLPLVAMLVAGAMTKGIGGGGQASGADGGLGGLLGGMMGGGGGGGLLGGLLGSLTGGGQAASPAAAPAGGLGSLGGLASMLDLDGDGNPLDDILGMAGKFAAR
ncbi:MAG: hypothetical protein DI547_12105 [Sphingobium sp.]|nr:MAG: hypothetical protein DI547_12105 [Sphingobium sp.]